LDWVAGAEGCEEPNWKGGLLLPLVWAVEAEGCEGCEADKVGVLPIFVVSACEGGAENCTNILEQFCGVDEVALTTDEEPPNTLVEGDLSKIEEVELFTGFASPVPFTGVPLTFGSGVG
jgi:hypothetical protein